MNKKNDIFFNYDIPSSSYLERALKNLSKFDDDENPQYLFYAALELRFGIEARINEYIKANSKQQKLPAEKIKEFPVTKLLKKLANIAPEALKHSKFAFLVGEGKAFDFFEYTPVTKKLATDHGKLGEFLHFKFFTNNPNWYYKKRMKQKYGKMTILDFRDFLEEISEELKETNKGLLLAPPKFLELIEGSNEI